MAIINEVTNSNPMDQLVFAGSQESPFVQLPEVGEQIDFCICKYECNYQILVLAQSSGDSRYKNDKTAILRGLSSDSSILEILLVDSQGNETPINDNTFGTYYPKGSFTNTPNQANYVGFIVDWQKVLTIKGAGVYFFKITETTFGQEFEEITLEYRLYPYSDDIAYKTVRFQFEQNGLIESGLDYTGLNWINEIRVKGKVNYSEPIVNLDNYQDAQRQTVQILDSVVENWEAETYFIPKKVGDIFVKNGILANHIYVDSYDFGAYDRLENKDVVITEVSSFKGNYTLNTRGAFTFSMEERTKDTVKRNVL